MLTTLTAANLQATMKVGVELTVIGALALILFLVYRAIAHQLTGERAARAVQTLLVLVVPLGMVFAVNVFFRISDMLQ